MNPLPLVLATLRRHRAAFALFTLLIACAVALGAAVSASERALRQGSARAADRFDLVAAAPGSRLDVALTAIYLKPGTVPLLNAAAAARILAEPRAEIAAPIAFGDSFHGAPVVGTVAAFVDHLSGGLAEGRLFKSAGEAVVGAASPLRLGETFRPVHGLHEHGADADDDGDEHEHAVDITIVGRMKPTGTPWDRAIIVPVEQVWQVHGLPAGHAPGETRIGPPFDPAFVSGVPAIVLKPGSVSAAYGLRNVLRTDASMAFFPAEVLTDLYSAMADVRALMSAFAIAAQALVALAVLAALAALFALNRRQFATLRILGAPRRFFIAGVWIYVALIIVCGAALGLALGIGAAAALSGWIARETGVAMAAQIGAAEVRLALAFTGAGLALALIPALLAARGEPLAGLNG